MIFLLNNWRLIAMGLVIGTLTLTAGFYKWQATRWENKYETFRIEVRAAGIAAEIRAKEIEAKNKKAKEVADAESVKRKRDLDSLYAAYRSLRDSRTRGSLLPQPAAGSPSPDRIAFDRESFDRAVSDFDTGVTGLLEKGDKAIADLNTAKGWAKGL